MCVRSYHCLYSDYLKNGRVSVFVTVCPTKRFTPPHHLEECRFLVLLHLLFTHRHYTVHVPNSKTMSLERITAWELFPFISKIKDDFKLDISFNTYRKKRGFLEHCELLCICSLVRLKKSVEASGDNKRKCIQNHTFSPHTFKRCIGHICKFVSL